MRPFVLHSCSEIVMPTQVTNKLLAFENFFFVLEGLGKQSLPADVTIGDYKTLGSQYCQLVMPLPPSSHAASLPDPERYCFAAAFAPRNPLSTPSPFHFYSSHIYRTFQLYLRVVERLSSGRHHSPSCHPPNIRIIYRLDPGYLIASLSAGGAAPKAAAAWSPSDRNTVVLSGFSWCHAAESN